MTVIYIHDKAIDLLQIVRRLRLEIFVLTDCCRKFGFVILAEIKYLVLISLCKTGEMLFCCVIPVILGLLRLCALPL